MEDTYITITPHVIERWVVADKVEVAGFRHLEDGERVLVVFTNEDEAEAFRAASGKYPASEGFEVVAVDHEGLRNLIRLWGYRSFAVCGLEPGGGADFFDAEVFCGLLEEVA